MDQFGFGRYPVIFGPHQSDDQLGVNPSHGTRFVRTEISCIVKLCENRGEAKVRNQGIPIPVDKDIRLK